PSSLCGRDAPLPSLPSSAPAVFAISALAVSLKSLIPKRYLISQNTALPVRYFRHSFGALSITIAKISVSH
ncbi:hypothetical protein, partial [Klebsiella pneumoniae]